MVRPLKAALLHSPIKTRLRVMNERSHAYLSSRVLELGGELDTDIFWPLSDEELDDEVMRLRSQLDFISEQRIRDSIYPQL